MKQYSLFEAEKIKNCTEIKEWGTFKESLRAPIHNWFTYPAGFSYKAVESGIHTNGIRKGQIVYDPFMGSGTTNLTAKKLAVNSYGVESHPFVFRIAVTKMNWDIDRHEIIHALRELETEVKNQKKSFDVKDIQIFLENEFPELILKCYENNTLLDLLFIRNAIIESSFSQEVKNFFFVALTSVLRQVSTAATGWPYIAPNKQKTTSLNKNAVSEFSRRINKMADDIHLTIQEADKDYKECFHKLFNADSRYTEELISDSSVDYVFTSPPI